MDVNDWYLDIQLRDGHLVHLVVISRYSTIISEIIKHITVKNINITTKYL